MSVRYELSEFFDNTLDRSEDFGFQVADSTRRALCGLWQNLPGALIPNPGDSFRRGALSALCQDFEPPPAPAPPFSGGQCQAQYTVTVSYSGQAGPTGGTCQPTSGTVGGSLAGPLSLAGISESGSGNQYFLVVGIRDRNGAVSTIATGSFNRECGGGSVTGITVVRADGQPDNCGSLPESFPGGDVINEGDVITNEDITIEGDRTTNLTIDFSPTFEDEVCIGQFVFCADVEGNRVTLDVGGVTINLPGTGGGDGGGSQGGDGDTITNIDTKVTNIQEAQEQCCNAIIQSISSFRNRATELFNEAELRDACIVGLIRNSTNLVPRFVGPASVRASGSTGVLGSVRYVQPSRGDSCFLVIEVSPTESYRGKRYKILDDGDLVEASFGHAELVFLDGTTVSPSETGIRTISARKTFIWFPYVSSGNAIRLSLAGGLEYEVRDPGFRWSPSDLPQCEELVDPSP